MVEVKVKVNAGLGLEVGVQLDVEVESRSESECLFAVVGRSAKPQFSNYFCYLVADGKRGGKNDAIVIKIRPPPLFFASLTIDKPRNWMYLRTVHPNLLFFNLTTDGRSIPTNGRGEIRLRDYFHTRFSELPPSHSHDGPRLYAFGDLSRRAPG